MPFRVFAQGDLIALRKAPRLRQSFGVGARLSSVLLLLTSVPTVAVAAGGAGANGNAAGGAGGVGPNGQAGSDGASSGGFGFGGGGGGGGAGGGNGGNGGNGALPGFAGGQFPGAAGSDSNSSGGAGGGAGASNGYVGAANVAFAASFTGGNGGAGGNANINGAGGGGGEGGYVGVLTGAGTTTNNANLTGGTGGNGGASVSGFSGASGGDGGVGLYYDASASLFNLRTIQGGNGGLGGANGGPAGLGGIGVVGSGLTIDNTGGTISGGSANLGTGAQNYAVQFNGGANYLGGAGTINGGVNVAGGSFQPALPGSAVGTALTITSGPLVFAPGTSFNIRITPTATDNVIVNGQATLTGATVNVAAGAGTYTTGSRQILSANTRGGTTFAGVTSNLAFLLPTLTYVGDGLVFLNITGNAGSIDYRTAAITQNQRAVATGLTNASNFNGNSGPLLNALNQLTAAQAQAAFDSLSGEGITATQNLAHREAELFTSAIFDQTTFYGAGGGNQITLTAPEPGSGFVALAPQSVTPGDTLKAQAIGQPIRELADLPSTRAAPAAPAFAPIRTWRAWGTGFGGTDDIHGNAVIGSATQNNTIYGGSVGVDYQLTPNYLLGVAVGGSNGDFNVPNRATSGSTTGGHIAVYSLANFGPFYGASSVSGSFYQNRTTRNVAGFGGLATETERGNFFSDEFRSRLEFGRHFASPFGFGGVITPFVALEIAQLRSNGFGEQTIAGGPGGFGGQGLFALNVSGQSTADVPSFVGARFQTIVPLGNGMTFAPSLQAAFVHEFAPNRSLFASIASLPGATFLVDGARPARNAAQVKAGGELAIGPRTAIFANFDGEFSGVNQFYAGKGGIKYLF